MKLTYKQAEKNRPKYVFSTDDFGGIRRFILRWGKDEVLDRGAVIYEYPTIEDFFEDYGEPIFSSLTEAAKYFSKQQ